MQLAAPHVHPGCFSFSFFFFALVCLSLKLDYEIDTAEPEASHCLCARLLYTALSLGARARRARRGSRASGLGRRVAIERRAGGSRLPPPRPRAPR